MTNEHGYMHKAAMLPNTGDDVADGEAKAKITKEGIEHYMQKFSELLNTFPNEDLPLIVFGISEGVKALEAQMDELDKVGIQLMRKMFSAGCSTTIEK